MKLRWSWYGIACALCLLACEGSGGLGDAGVPLGGRSSTGQSDLIVGADPTVAPSELARALCAEVKECGDDLDAVTEEACVTYFSQPCLFPANVLLQDGLEACVTSIRAIECGQQGTIELSLACTEAAARSYARLHGLPLQEAEGGVCGDGVGCANRQICDAFGSACGVCQAIPEVGDPCGAIGACLAGYCDSATDICMALKPNDASCALDEECESEHCSSENVCKPDTEQDACSSDLECATRCVDGRCAVPSPIGGPCTDSNDCEGSLRFCDDGRCKLVGRCTPGEVGEPCGSTGCARNLQCEDRVCVDPGVPGMPDGAACTLAEQCESGYCGHAILGDTPSVCARRPAGFRCGADDDCKSGQCVQNQCSGTGMCNP